MFRHLIRGCLCKQLQICNGIRKMSSSSALISDITVQRIVWIDMEMTGLNEEIDQIMEIACIVTDSDLKIVAESPNLIINQPPTLLDSMDDWCKKTHGKSGLTEACMNSTLKVDQAEHILMKFLSEHVIERCSPLAGSSIYMDRIFLRKYMPKLNEFLHYRIIDVSTVKELCKRWNPQLYDTVPKKNYTHRAIDDIRESIQELDFYRQKFFVNNLNSVYKFSGQM